MERLAGWERALSRRLSAPLVELLARWGLSPNTVSLIGLGLSAASGLALAQGSLYWGGALILLGGLFDLLDGALARARGLSSPFGALLDSTLDRYSDIFPLLGLAFLYRQEPGSWVPLLALAAAVGSLMVSYLRARAESLGAGGETGFFTRPHRLVLLALGLLLGLPLPTLALLALGSHATALERLWHAGRQLRGG